LKLKREAAVKKLTRRQKLGLIGVGEIARADSQAAFPV
jgi:predicted GIY-YIG superfamily endonuclease